MPVTGKVTPPINEENLSIDQMISVNAMFRKRIVEEDTLINQRMSWMIWSEALLLATWGTTYAKLFDHEGKTTVPFFEIGNNVLLLSSCFGCLIAILSAISILTAQREISHLQDLYERKFPKVEADSRMPKLTGHAANHFLGHLVPYIVPAGFLLLQIMLARYSWFLPSGNM